MSHPRGLSADEAAAWEKLSATVTPLTGRRRSETPQHNKAVVPDARVVQVQPKAVMPVRSPPVAVKAPPAPVPHRGLDSHWDRRIKAGALQPDFTLDLHGHGLDSAYDRLMQGLDQARAMEAKIVLLIAGRSRPVDPADRGEQRGAIRAKLLDWLAASRHSAAISAVRKAHIRHGGEGALYLVLKRAK